MAARRYKSFLYNWFWEIGRSPFRILEFMQFLLLGWLLLSLLWGLGGFLAYGESMVGVSKLLLALAATHALGIAFENHRPTLSWELLLPVPFLLYAWAHYQFLSPAPWASAPMLAVYIQAYAIYFIVYNSIHGHRSIKWAIGMYQLVVTVALLAGFFQFYLFPNWMPVADRARNPEYAHGAAGFLQDPTNLGAILLAFLPFFAILTSKHLRSGPSWILQGFLSIAMVVGVLLTTHRSGLLILLAVLLALPFFLTGDWRRRRKLWFYGALVIGIAGVGIWFGTDALRERIGYFLSAPMDDLPGISRQVAISQFLGHPLLGQGLGTYSLSWGAHLPHAVAGSCLYAFSWIAGLLAETGLTGLVLAGVPVLLLGFHAFRCWRPIPFLKLSRNDLESLQRLPRKHRRRRRVERRRGRMPYQKAVLGATLLGLAALLLYAGWDYILQLPLGIFLFASLLAIMAASCGELQRREETRKLWIATACLPVLLAFWAAVFGAPRFYADHLTYTAREHLEHLLEDTNLIFLDPGALCQVEEHFRGAIDLVPEHGAAWTGLASARLAYLYADLDSADEVARAALESAERAVELAPLSWLAHFNLARVRILLGGDGGTVARLLDRAAELAPYRPEPVGLKGSLLLLEDPRSGQGMALLEASLELDPGYGPSVRALQRNRFQLGGPSGNGSAMQQEVVTRAILAEQFRPEPDSRELIRGAGLPVIVDYIPQLPEQGE
ncbi:MAG: hypothetical protein ACP5I4_04850 [Oceanipulchritudo sp.]